MAIDQTQSTKPPYEAAWSTFDQVDLDAWLHGDLATGVNACVECCDRHCGSGQIALRCIDLDQTVTEYSFEDLRRHSAKVASMLAANGIGAGDVVAGLLPRTVELVAVILGAWRLGAIYQPLFTAFGPKAIEQRFKTSQAKLVVTDSNNRAKLEDVPNAPLIATVRAEGVTLASTDIDFRAAFDDADESHEPILRQGDALFMLLSTSGTTGPPKGVPVPLRAMLAFTAYMRYGIQLTDNDVFWNIADPGWAYGLYYAICGPLLLGASTTLYEGGFTAESTWDIVAKLGVTNLAGSPTAYRQLIAAGPEAAPRGQLRVVSSAGEPLNPEIFHWFDKHLSAPIHDHYGQTEMGMCVNNHHGLAHPVRAGSAGLAMPGYRVAVLDDDGNERGPNQPGVLAIDVTRSPLMWFTGYYKSETPAIAGGYYRTGDTVELEPDGSISFVGRADDVITSSGYRIGPFDVESALIEHDAVVESAVVGVPDPERTELVKAFVVLAAGVPGTEALKQELQDHVKRRLAAHAFPRQIEFTEELPKTPSGKIQRFVLRASEVAKARKARAGD